MKELLRCAILSLACSVVLLPDASGPARADETSTTKTARGDGVIELGEHAGTIGDDEEEGRGVLHFEIRRSDDGVTGSLLFAAEHSHGALYPDLVVRVSSIEQADFRQNSVTYTAKGRLHEQEVLVTGSAYDGEGTSRADSFSITCTDESGEVLLEAHGDLFIGDIRVGKAD